ncbi:hypothetical protein [Nocardia brasiliensis]|uniref:hypothetical protein n=1 Tax=Nocardia brasiliensis TaxID=37326 RepID=UPI00366AF5F6
MNLIGRLGSARSVFALLMAVLLAVPMVDCVLHDEQSHTYAQLPQSSTAAPAFTSHASDRHHHGAIGDSGEDCGQHLTRCIVQSVLPGAATIGLLFQLLIAFLAAIAGAASATRVAANGVRGPPATVPLAVEGRDILTKFCISRR